MKSRIDSNQVSGLAKDIYDAVVYYIMHFQDFEGNVQLQIND